ncbi:hypothetical protein HDF13_001432 [Edaphobacter lichenicola]|uniref:Uncharacterized protein n=1 Tax=Tunturiibacter gelidiferens TaxID=3069689 RepID=A0ACC5NXF1_9BACT|nr:hypothetical protein [Edaphobacter lichenicola]
MPTKSRIALFRRLALELPVAAAEIYQVCASTKDTRGHLK